MKNQIRSTKPRRPFAPMIALTASALATLALALSASAQTLPPPRAATGPQPAAIALLVGPTVPGYDLFFNVVHLYPPSDICAAYGVDALHNEGWTGQGQTIVIVDAYGSPTALQDLQTFSVTFGLPAPDLTIIYPNGQPSLNTSGKLSWAVETSLDLQWAHAIAPDAKLVLIAANPAEADGVQGFLQSMLRGMEYAIANYPGSPISQSFAITEEAFNSATNLLLRQFEAVYQQADAAGCTPLAASGDWGSANQTKPLMGAKSSDVYPYPTVCWPASSPSVTAVGGTWLQYHWRWDPQTNFAAFAALGLNPDPFDPALQAFLRWDPTHDQTEAVWREDWFVDLAGCGLATGGGLSAVFPIPSWQAGLPSSLTQGARALPDVSWNAAVDGGVWVLTTPLGGWNSVGGTSAGTPQIAGVVALVNQMRASVGKGPIGHLAPKLYQLPTSDFNDIVPQTFGFEDYAVTLQDNFRYGYDVPGLPTTAGYDLTTGLGSPKVYNLAHDLADMFP